MVNRLTSRIAARSMARQATTLTRADDLAAATEAIVQRAWADVLKTLAHATDTGRHHAAMDRVRMILTGIVPQLQSLIGGRLLKVADWSHQFTADSLARQIPVKRLKSTLRESREIQERDEGEPGFLRMFLTRLGKIAFDDFASPLDNDDLSDDAKRDLLLRLIFPAPSRRQAFGMVYAGDWMTRLANETRLAAPADIARVLTDATAGGQSIRDLAKALQPVVNGVRSTARRIARDETLRVAHTAQRNAWKEVDELIVGEQVFAVDHGHSPTSRPEHRARHGTVYYKSPKPGQKGMNECPRPPYEADGTIAYNCRCWTSPVFASEENDPEASGPSPALDMAVAGDWFDRASARDRRAAVGAENYGIATRILDRTPEWSDFTDHAGDLLSGDALESALQFQSRRRSA